MRSRTYKTKSVTLGVRASLLGLSLVHTVSQAATIEVNSLLDVSAADALCTLREAMVSVNQSALQPGCSIVSGTGALGVNDVVEIPTSLGSNNVVNLSAFSNFTLGNTIR